MKTIGFLTLHDKTYNGSKDLKELIETPRAYSKREVIIQYLESGYDFTGVPLMLHDDDDEPMFGLAYLTDGEWIWPNYFSYYLKKYPNMEIDIEFIKYLEENNFSFEKPSKEKIREIDSFFDKAIWGN